MTEGVSVAKVLQNQHTVFSSKAMLVVLDVTSSSKCR